MSFPNLGRGFDSPIPHMQKPSNPLVLQLLLVAIIALGISFTARHDSAQVVTYVAKDSLPAAANVAVIATTTGATSTAPISKPVATSTKAIIPKVEAKIETPTIPASPNRIVRIKTPYPSTPLPSNVVNQRSRAALVNILCTATSGFIRPISGSGIIIDSRGVILTNAHVAQYVLLSQSKKVNLECVIRTGSPAESAWIPRVLYIPRAWVSKHASELTVSHVEGTGEHDYALLWIAESVNETPLPATFPSVPYDTREGIAFVDDSVLTVSYPAEFLGALAATSNLYAVSSPTIVQNMLTFTKSLVDALSLGGSMAAQSGSSGGGVINAWGYVVGLITTMSEGATTDDRDLHAITLSYIDRDLKTQLGINLDAVLDADPSFRVSEFTLSEAPELTALLLENLKH